MSSKSLLSLQDLAQADLNWILQRGRGHAEDRHLGADALRGQVVGLLFTRTSTRTRTAFSTAVAKLGGSVLAFGPGDLQLNTGETLEDTGRVLGGMLDALVVRTAGDPLELRRLSADAEMPVVNAMTADEHPTQAISDLTCMLRRFGRLDGLRVLYVGEGNNTAVALTYAIPRYPGTQLHLRTPAGYGLPADVLASGRQLARSSAAGVEERHDMEDLPHDIDIVYTTRWETTGTVKADPDWRTTFEPFRVDETLLDRYPDAVFMHDLPAHRGEEVTADVIDGPSSIAFEQSHFKLHSAKAVMEWCLCGRPSG